MSKKKKSLNLSKPPLFSQEDLKKSPSDSTENPLSQAATISASETIDFQNAINQSRQNIFEADEKAKGKRGRKALPRDAQGNIIRDANPHSGGSPQGHAAPLILNQQSIEENKMILRPLMGAASDFAEKYSGSKDARASETEVEALVATGAILLEKYMPNAMSKYGTEATFCFVLLTWTVRIRNEKIKTIQNNIAMEKKKSELQNGGLPNENVRTN